MVAGLQLIGDGCPLHGGWGVGHGEINRLRQADADRIAFVQIEGDLHIGDKIVHRAAKQVFRQSNLLVILGVHEAVLIAGFVQIFHFPLFECDPVDFVVRAEFMLCL